MFRPTLPELMRQKMIRDGLHRNGIRLTCSAVSKEISTEVKAQAY